MTWDQVGADLVQHGFAFGVALGASLGLGGGAGIITFLHHMPAPFEGQVWLGAVYDTLQDRIKNMDRIGARRPCAVKEKP